MFQLLFERSGDGIFLFDPVRQVFVDCNEAAVQMMRATSRDQLLLVDPADLSPERQPDGRVSREKSREMTALALERGSHRFEWTARRYDGTEFCIEVLTTPVASGEQPLLAIVCRDISYRKRAEEEIQELNASLERRVQQRTAELLSANEQLKIAEQQARRRAEQAQRHRDALLELAQLNKSDLAQALCTICAVAASTLEVARVSYWSLTEEASALVCRHLYLLADKKAAKQAEGQLLRTSDCPAYFKALATRQPIVASQARSHVATNELAEGYLKPLGISSMLDAPVWVAGHVVGVLCHEHVGPERDWTTEEVYFASALAAMVSLAIEESQRARSERLLRESESRFSAAFQASPMYVTISRFADGRYVLVNETFLKQTGYRQEEVLERNSQELSLWADPAERELFWEELRKTGHIHERECRIRNRWGKVFTFLISADMIEINAVPHLLTVGLDITERKRAELELHRTLSREKELGTLRSNFVSMVSHEFRTPLGIIQSSAEILDDYLDRLDARERKEHLGSIHRNTRRMATLMEEVLLLSGLDSEKMEFKPAPLNLCQFAQGVAEEILAASEHRCPIRLELPPTPLNVRADERLLQHIFTNLLSNAVKYSQPGAPVGFEISSHGPDVVCTVRDRGIGIPESDREWLFAAFQRGRNVGDRPGTGLGLVIVKRCVDLHGGSIQVDSKPGKGTIMTVRLPRSPADDLHQKPSAPNARARKNESPGLSAPSPNT
jgi:PAS domain S-box-containing protein